MIVRVASGAHPGHLIHSGVSELTSQDPHISDLELITFLAEAEVTAQLEPLGHSCRRRRPPMLYHCIWTHPGRCARPERAEQSGPCCLSSFFPPPHPPTPPAWSLCSKNTAITLSTFPDTSAFSHFCALTEGIHSLECPSPFPTC